MSRAVALTCTLALVGLGPLAGASARTAPAAPKSVAEVVPDLYGLEGLGASVHGTTQVRFFERRACSQVLQTLESGQWAIHLFAEPTEGIEWYVGTMTYGSRIAMLSLLGSGSSCTGSVTAEVEQPISGTGDLQVSGTAKAVSFYCQVGPDPNGKDLKDLRLIYIGLYRTPSRSFMLMTSGPATPGRHELTPDESGDGGVSVIPIKQGADPVAAMTAFFGSMYGSQASDGSADSGDDMPEGVTGMYNGPGTLKIRKSDSLDATISGSGLVDQMTQHGELSITAGVTCDP